MIISHKHKFIQDNRKKIDKDNIYGTLIHPDGKCGKYDPPLPTSVVKEDCYKMNERHQNGKMKDLRKLTGYEPEKQTEEN